MTIPNVNLTILDGALGILPDSLGEICVFMGCSSKGPLNTPYAFSKGRDIQKNFGFGDTVEAACHAIEVTGKPAIFVRIEATTDGYAGPIDVSGVEGSSVVTIDAASKPWDEYEGYFIVTTGGTIGSDGIKFRWSLDGGRNLSPVTSLGTATSWTFPDSGNPGIKLDFAAGDLDAGDIVTFRTDAPKWGNSDVSAGMLGLSKTSLPWNFMHLVGPTSAAEATNLHVELLAMQESITKTQYRWAMVNVRRPDIGEDEGDYLIAMSTDYASFASDRIVVGFGYAKTLSSLSRREYRRPAAFGAIARAIEVGISTDLGEVAKGPLPGVRIKDSNQNPDDHDEQEFPGADALRFLTLRSLDGFPGVYITNPNVMATPGSDFSLLQYRRVMDKGCATVKFALTLRLGKAVRVDKKTGFILRQDKVEIEAGVTAALRNVLLAPSHASDAIFTLSSTDNILSTKTLTGEARITPKGYIKQINVEIGFVNPVIQTI